jgi:hypothetical protein
MRREAVVVVSLALLIGAAQADIVHAQGLTIGAGSTFYLGSAVLDLGCADLVIEPGGTLFGEQGVINLSGSWFGYGTTVPGTSLVSFTDGCPAQVSTIRGDNHFYNLTFTTTAGMEARFEAGSEQDVEGRIEFVGADGSPLLIRSTVDGVEAFLALSWSVDGVEAFLALSWSGSSLVDWVDVMDNHAVEQWMAPGPAERYNSIDSGNLLNWFLNYVTVPALSSTGVTTLVIVMLILGVGMVRRGSFF